LYGGWVYNGLMDMKSRGFDRPCLGWMNCSTP